MKFSKILSKLIIRGLSVAKGHAWCPKCDKFSFNSSSLHNGNQIVKTSGNLFICIHRTASNSDFDV